MSRSTVGAAILAGLGTLGAVICMASAGHVQVQAAMPAPAADVTTITGTRVFPHSQALTRWEDMQRSPAPHTPAHAEAGDWIPIFAETVPAQAQRQAQAARHGSGLQAAFAPTLGLRFEAANRTDTINGGFPSGIRPPDTMGAVGPNHFMEVINNNVSIFDKATGYRLSSVFLIDFFAEVHTEDIPFDPRVLFDIDSGRWIAMAADCRCDPNSIVVGVSITDDPTGEWFFFGYEAGGFADYPTLGVDQQGVYIAADFVEKVWIIEKAPLLQDPPSVGVITEMNVSIAGALQPAHTYDPAGPQYFIQTSSSSQLRVFEQQGPITNPTLVNLGTVPVPFFGSPPNAPAQGSSTPISVGNGAGSRLMMSVYRDGSLWTCHTIGLNGRCACRWYEVDPAAMSLIQSGTVADTSLHYYYPAVMVNAIGDVAMGFSGSDATQYVACYFTGRRSTDPAGQMAAPVLLKAGEAAYESLDNGGRNRWGDYSYTTLDPVDELTFWTIQEYAESPEDVWGTWVGQLSFDGFDCNDNSEADAADIAFGSSSDCDTNGVPDECQADCNGNDIADTCDIADGLSDDNSNGIPDICEGPCPGNVDGDGMVGVLDLVQVITDWGACPGCAADLTGDGMVDVSDLVLVILNWGPCPTE